MEFGVTSENAVPTGVSEDVLGGAASARDAAAALRDTLLANLVMIGEIPAPTFSEQQRVRFLQDRFTECGLAECSTDEVGNAVGIVPGTGGERNIVVVAHADTLFGEREDHTITVMEQTVVGAGIGDNSLGLAALATLPTLLEQMSLRLRSNLVLLASSRSLGTGDLGGLRFFMNNRPMEVHNAIVIEGVELGRLNYTSLGMVRGQIAVSLPPVFDWTRFGARSAVLILNDVISRILEIPLPRKPRTSVMFGSINAGEAFDTLATGGELRLEVRSEASQIVGQVTERIEQIVEELAAETGAEISFERPARREPGGIAYGHPLVQVSKHVMERLGVEALVGPSMAELSEFIRHDVPAVTIGLTHGQRHRKRDEVLQIEPMFIGMAQLVTLLRAIDEGMCDEPD